MHPVYDQARISGGAFRGTLFVVAAGASIAALAPWGVPIGVAISSHLMRAVLFATAGLSGAMLAQRAGLQLALNSPRAVLASVGLGAACAAYCALIDAGFHSLPTNFVTLVAPMSLSVRLSYFMLRAFNEAVFYQLFLGSAFAFIASRFTPSAVAMFAAIFAAHLVNCALNVSAPFAPVALAYDCLRYIAPGLLWTAMYLRLGLASVLIAHPLVHLIYQPLI